MGKEDNKCAPHLLAPRCVVVKSLRRLSFTFYLLIFKLPWLSFQMSHSGDNIWLPLSELLLPGQLPGGRNRFCIEDAGSIQQLSSSSSSSSMILGNKISFGSIPLSCVSLLLILLLSFSGRAFYSAFNMKQGRVGFANRFVPTQLNGISYLCLLLGIPSVIILCDPVSSLGCPAKHVCFGDQIFEPSKNGCSNPPCELMYFQSLDVPSMTCHYVSFILIYPSLTKF
jgi:hypothetical protein